MVNPYLSYERYGDRKNRELTNPSLYPVLSPPLFKFKGRDLSNLTSVSSTNHTDRFSTGSEAGSGLYHTASLKSRPYDLEPTSYKKDGFQIIGSELAEDPLTNVRTMRNHLQQVSRSSSLGDSLIRAELAQAASDLLSKAELKLAQLQSKRSDALFFGDSRTAEKLTKQMKEISERAIFNAYADLIMDADETNMFGMHSKWVPRKGHRKHKNRKSSHHRYQKEHSFLNEKRDIVFPSHCQRSPSNSTSHQWDIFSGGTPLAGRNNQTSSNPRNHNFADVWREPSRRQFTSPPPASPTLSNASVKPEKNLREIVRRPSSDYQIFDEIREPLAEKRRSLSENRINSLERLSFRKDDISRNSNKRITFSPPVAELKIKKNERLSLKDGGMQNAKFSGRLGETRERIISSAAICPYCTSRDPGFVNTDYLKQHMAEKCNLLTKCEFCDKIVETSELNEHHLNRCPFVEDTLEACADCGLARYPGKDRHPKCRGKNPPNGADWCPLCSSKVEPSSSKDAWLNHLSAACYNNPRNRHWPQPNSLDDTRGDELLASLYEEDDNPSHNKNRKCNPRGRLRGTSQLSQQLQQPTIDTEQMRAAIKKLNHEQRINRAKGAAAENARMHANDDDDDPIGH